MDSNEFLEKYGEEKVVFHSYYKYTFTYKATLENGNILTVCIGGNSDNIYKFSVTAGLPVRVNDMWIRRGTVCTPEGVEIEEFNDY